MRSQNVHRLLVLLAVSTVLAFGACSPKPEPATPTNTAALARAGANGGLPALPCDDLSQKWAQGYQADSCWKVTNDDDPYCYPNCYPEINPDLWPDACSPGGPGWGPSQASFDQLSWRTFLYAVWPADPNNPGTPDKNQLIGAKQGDAFLPTVWETFKSAEDLFNSNNQMPTGCSADGPRVLTMTSKVPAAAFHALSDASLPDSIDQAFSGPLVDQNGKLVYYDVRINETEYTAIVRAGAQTKSSDELNCTGQYKKHGCIPFEFPLGSMEVKAAWKQLSPEEVRSGRFYSQSFQIQTSANQCSTVPMGLVGLHISRKTPLSSTGHPSWAWSTFEHADNVPAPGSNGSGGSYSFFNPKCSPHVSAASCAGVSEKDRSAPEYACCENLDRYKPGAPPVAPTPNQITRLDNAPPETRSCNEVYAKTRRGIWDHYSLVSTQWPNANDGPDVVTTPAKLRNSVLESYHTKWVNTGGQPRQINNSSCMGCHSYGVDMSWLFLGNASSH